MNNVNLPIYRYLFNMSREGFTKEEFCEVVHNGPEQFTRESASNYLELLLKARILEIKNDLYFFRLRNKA